MGTLTDKERAVKLREAADLLDECDVEAGMNLRFKADELDPPQPEYPEGTVARVRTSSAVWLAERQGGAWVLGGGSFSWEDSPEVVEVIPTLPPGHVAVPMTISAPTARHHARLAFEDEAQDVGHILANYADAVEASQR